MDRLADPKYAVHNRSRRSVSVDLQKKEGVEVVLRLIDKADGLTEAVPARRRRAARASAPTSASRAIPGWSTAA